jgi:hypothetical protein
MDELISSTYLDQSDSNDSLNIKHSSIQKQPPTFHPARNTTNSNGGSTRMNFNEGPNHPPIPPSSGTQDFSSRRQGTANIASTPYRPSQNQFTSPGLSSIHSSAQQPPIYSSTRTEGINGGGFLSSTQTSNFSSTGGVSGVNDFDEKAKLEKQNFDLKMRIYYLEENLHKLEETNYQRELNSNDHTSKLTDLKLQLEEKNIELEQRNLLLVKAKNAMEILKNECQQLKNDHSKQIELEQKMHSLKEMNYEIEKDYQKQLDECKSEIHLLKQKCSRKDSELSLLEDQIVSTPLLLALAFSGAAV